MKRFMKLAALVAGIHLLTVTFCIFYSIYFLRENFDALESDISWIDNLIMGAIIVLEQPLLSFLTLKDIRFSPDWVEWMWIPYVGTSVLWGVVIAGMINGMIVLKRRVRRTAEGRTSVSRLNCWKCIRSSIAQAFQFRTIRVQHGSQSNGNGRSQTTRGPGPTGEAASRGTFIVRMAAGYGRHRRSHRGRTGGPGLRA